MKKILTLFFWGSLVTFEVAASPSPPEWLQASLLPEHWDCMAGIVLGIIISAGVQWLFRSRKVRRLQTKHREAVGLAKRFGLTLQAIGDAVIATDAKERITMINASAARMTGWGTEEAVGKPLSEVFQIVSYLDDTPVESPVRQALQSGKVIELANHTDLIARDGSRRHIADSAAPVEDKGTLLGAILVFRDVTDEYDSRDRLRMNNELLQSAAQHARLEYFHRNVRKDKTWKGCEKFWPLVDGKPKPVQGWVLDEDVGPLQQEWRRFFAGEIKNLRLTYRTREEGKIKYFMMYAQVRETDEGSHLPHEFFGFIQDVTELQVMLRDHHDINSLLNTVLENLPNPVLVKNLSDDGRYVLANRNFAEVCGMPPEEIIGKTDCELFPNQKEAEGFRADDRKAEAAGKMVQFENRFRAWNGAEYDMLINKSVFRNSDGSRMLVAIGLDISEIKQVQHKLEESNQILQLLFDNLPVGIAVKDPDHEFRYVGWSRWLENNTGMKAAEVLGKNDDEISPYPGMESYFQGLDRETLEQEVVTRIESCTSAIGETMICDLYKKLLVLNADRRLLISLHRDVTRQRTLEMEREEMIARLQNYVEYERIINHCMQRIALQEDLESSIQYLLKEIGETLNADRCYIFRYHADGHHADNTHEWVRDGIDTMIGRLGNLDMNRFPGVQQRLLNKKDIVLPDLSQETPEDMRKGVEFLKHQQNRSVLLIGIWDEERLSGFLGVDFVRNTRSFTECDLHILYNTVTLLQLARARDRQANALADSLSLQTQMFQSLNVPILLLDTEFNIVKTNPALNRFFADQPPLGSSPKCNLYFCRREVSPEDCPARQVLATRQTHTLERVIGKYHVQLTAQPIFNREGKLIYILESGFDVTAMRNQQQELKQNNIRMQNYLNQDQLINDCLEMLVIEQDSQSLLRKITHRLSDELGVDTCMVSRYAASERMLHMVELCCTVDRKRALNQLSVIREDDFPECFRALKNRKAIALDMRQAEELLPEQREMALTMKPRGIQEIFCVGIWFQGAFWGHIGMEYASPEKHFGESEKRLVFAAARIIEVLLERESQRQQLARSEAEKNRIWEMMTIPLALFDANRNIVRVNPAMERLTGLTSAQMLAQPCNMSLCGKPVQPEDCQIQKVLTSQQAEAGEFHLLGREFEIHSLPIFENGSLVHILQSYIDITETTEAKQQLLQALEDARAAEKAKSYFLATMSHEIRTPLNAVIGFSELLQGSGIPPEEQKDYLYSINFAGNALLQLINDILDLSKLDSGQMRLAIEKDDFLKLCREMQAIFSLRIQEKGLKLKLHCPETLPMLYICVPRLRQVLLNLIGNAVKFTRKGEISITVDFRADTPETGTLNVDISDTGIGISQEYLSRIFNPFVQQNEVRGTQEGTGLGLAISRRLIETMGGTLTFESTENVGSSFFIRIPGLRYEAGEKPLKQAESVFCSRRNFSVLLVDDVPLNLKVLKAMLARFCPDIQIASSGRQALELLQNFHPDLILTDMWMPEMNGAELMKAIRLMPGNEKTMIFAVTADTESAGNFPMEDFDGILLKPVSLDKLEKLLQYIDEKKINPDAD